MAYVETNQKATNQNNEVSDATNQNNEVDLYCVGLWRDGHHDGEVGEEGKLQTK